jgi:hypothetical protein
MSKPSRCQTRPLRSLCEGRKQVSFKMAGSTSTRGSTTNGCLRRQNQPIRYKQLDDPFGSIRGARVEAVRRPLTARWRPPPRTAELTAQHNQSRHSAALWPMAQMRRNRPPEVAPRRRLSDRPDDLQRFRGGVSDGSSSPAPIALFFGNRFSRVSSTTPPSARWTRGAAL